MGLFKKFKQTKSEMTELANAEVQNQVNQYVTEHLSPSATDDEIRMKIVYFLRHQGRPSGEVLNRMIAQSRKALEDHAAAEEATHRHRMEIASVLSSSATDAEIQTAVEQWFTNKGLEQEIKVFGRTLSLTAPVVNDVKKLLRG